jgi:hypothetical protein
MNNKLLHRLLPKILAAMLPLTTAAQSLHTTAGVKLILSGPVNLVLNNTSFVNDGSFTAGSSKVLIVGNAGIQNIGGNGVTNLNNLSINKSAGFVQLNRNIAVANLLTMTQGNLELNTFSVSLGATGSLTGESSLSAVTGEHGGSITAVKKWIPGIAINPGNLGIEISTSNNLGVITVERSHLATELLNGGETIRRGYNITNTNFISIPDISLKLSYLDEELINNVEQGLVMFARSGIGNFMLPIGADASDPNQNFVHQSGLIQLGFFSVANDNGGAAFRFPKVDGPASGNKEPVIVRNSIVKAVAKIYPNPVHQSFTLEMLVPRPMKLSATLVNESGMVVDRKEIYCGGDNNTVNWNMLHFSPGNYYLKFNDKNIKTLKIVKY